MTGSNPSDRTELLTPLSGIVENHFCGGDKPRRYALKDPNLA